jgi:hypothetical protein
LEKRTGKVKSTPNGIAIYHIVKSRDKFENSANEIYELVYSAKQEYPNEQIHLYVDIEGHKNKDGGFDNDMFELQTQFITGLILQYINSVTMPLGSTKNIQMNKEMPPKLSIQ